MNDKLKEGLIKLLCIGDVIFVDINMSGYLQSINISDIDEEYIYFNNRIFKVKKSDLCVNLYSQLEVKYKDVKGPT